MFCGVCARQGSWLAQHSTIEGLTARRSRAALVELGCGNGIDHWAVNKSRWSFQSRTPDSSVAGWLSASLKPEGMQPCRPTGPPAVLGAGL